MKTGDMILGIFLGAFTLASFLLFHPRFRCFARWLPEGAPMSLRSRVLFALFPAFCTLAVFGVLASLSVVLALLTWLLVYFSYLADRKRCLREKTHRT